jgi:streptogramin lyase
MKHIFIFIMLLGSTLSMGQDFSANWTGHYSYLNVRSISEGNNKFVVAVQNAYFEYDPALNRSKVFTTIEGLNGREIANVYYSKEFKQALIGYENGLLQLKRDNRDDFQNFPEIVNRVSISPDVKNINHFYEFGDLAYISTDFGVVEFNLRRREFGNTFFIGNAGLNVKVNQTVVYNGVIYALTTNGIRFASVDNLNLIDFSVWNNLGNTSTNYTHAVVFNNKLYLVNEANQLFVLIGNNLDLELFYDEPVSDVKVSNEKLLVITKGNVFAYDEDLNEDLLFFGFSDQIADLSSASLLGDALYLGDRNLGFVSLSISNPSTVFSLSPDGPILNNVFNLSASFNQVWALYGEYTQFFNPFPLNTRGVSVLTNQSWTNITPTELFNARVIVDATVDPTNPSRVFLSSYYDGILVMQDKRIQRVLNGNNSGIEGISNVLDNRIGTIEYTPNGDFYFTNSLSLHPLKRKKPTGEIENIDLSGAFNNPQGSSVAKLAIDRQGNVYMASFSAGIIAYQPSSDRAARISSEITGVNFPSVSNPNPIMSALAIDETNRLWIGTNRGLRVMFNPSSIFDPNTPINVSPIIIVEDDGVAQELLFEQSITDIQVDGANNKWIATADSGVFQVSPNGQEVLNHFTRNNSPLPSNNVTSIAINGDTGEVYFGTANGLISYQSRITNAEEDLANVRVFPNPVRPKFTGAVTIDGLTQNANVKITDITGSLVFEENARGGSVQWDTTAFGKYKVSSGVYLVLITGSEGTKTKVKKIMVVR